LIVLFFALFALSCLITLAVLRSGAGQAARPGRTEAGRAPVSSIERIMGELSVQDFVLPRTIQPDSTGPYLLRPRLERWGEEQVDRYWIPLEEITLDLLQRENDRRMKELFEDIP
jgi:hypothetical protein